MISWFCSFLIAVACLPGQPPAQPTEAAEAGQAPAPAASAPSVDPISFRGAIAPILQESCVSCHGARKAEGGYRIDTLGKLEIAGDGGTAPIDRKEWTKSEIYQRIISEDPATRMPAEREPLTKEQIETIAKWLEQGALVNDQGESQPPPTTTLLQILPAPLYPPSPEQYRHPIPITAVGWNPDGSQWITSGYHELLVWNPSDGRLVRRLGNLPQRIAAIAWNPQGTHLAIAGGTPGSLGELRVVRWEDGQIQSSQLRGTDLFLDLAYNPSGTQIALACSDGSVRLVDALQLTEQKSLPSHADRVEAVAWSPDGTRLVSASRDKSAKVYDAVQGELLASFSGHGAAVHDARFLGSPQVILSIGADNKAIRWEVEGAKKTGEWAAAGEPFQLVQQGDYTAVAGTKSIQLLDPQAMQSPKSLEGPGDWTISASIHGPTGKLLTGSVNGQVQAWSLADGAAQGKLNAWPQTTAAPSVAPASP